MAEQLGSLARTHTCGALRPADVGKQAVLLGWVHRVRDLGSLLFLDVRDRHGLTQVIVEGDDVLLERVKRVRSEFVVAVIGEIERRSDDTVNLSLPTGEVEVRAKEVRVLNEAKTPPFSIAEDQNVSEETRLKYRYLDLRRPQLQHNIGLRHRVTMALRKYFDQEGFYEIETPILTKSTPEGARDFLVPARVHPGEFYALPQSPQIFKQILMIAGFDRYVQIARCFRDEALRADRQLEFTQVDLEMSFATPPMVLRHRRRRAGGMFPRDRRGHSAAVPPHAVQGRHGEVRIGQARSAVRHGDSRTSARCSRSRHSGFSAKPWRTAAPSAGSSFRVRRGIHAARSTSWSSRRSSSAPRAWCTRVTRPMVSRCPRNRLATKARARCSKRRARRRKICSCSLRGLPDAASKILGQLRLQVAKKENLIPEGKWELTWVTDFPLFDWNADEKRWDSVNHPFTAPREEDLHMLESDPGKVLAKAYDVILNGWELGGGSIRIHDRETQAKVFRLLGMSDEDAKTRFGFFLESLEYGTPPHGGLALGLDRICALLSGETSIREVIPFPKTTQAVDLMCDAPSTVDPRQLRELHIKPI